MKNSLKRGIWIVAITLIYIGLINSQQNVRYNSTGDSEIMVKGTSSMHDWQAVSNNVQGYVQIEEQFLTDSSSVNIPSLISKEQNPQVTLDVLVESLKSGKKAMDKNMYKALQSKKYSNIHYELITADIKAGSENDPSNLILETQGSVTIAGVSKPIAMDVQVKRLSNQIVVIGEIPLKMTDFNIDPPTALFGTLKTGNDITIVFKWTLAVNDEKVSSKDQ